MPLGPRNPGYLPNVLARVEKTRRLLGELDADDNARVLAEGVIALATTQHELNKRLWEGAKGFAEPHALTHMGADDSVSGLGIPEPIEVGDAGALGDPTGGFAPLDHEHPVPTGTPALLGSALAEGVSTAVPRLDHVHKRDILGRLAGVDIGVRGAINWLDTASIDFTVNDDPGNDELEISAAVLAAGIDHGGLAGLGDDDHPQYLLLAGRAGGQSAFGGTAASETLTLRGTTNANLGTINLNSPVVFGPYQASGAAYGFDYSQTESFPGAFVGGGLNFSGTITMNNSTFIYESFRGSPTIISAATPAFAAYTVMQSLPVLRGGATAAQRPIQALILNCGPVIENSTPVTTMTCPSLSGINWGGQVRATVATATMNVTNQNGMIFGPRFSTVSGSSVNLGIIRAIHCQNPSVALFQPSAGAEFMVAYYGLDMDNISFGGAARTVAAVRSALASATNVRFLDHTGSASSRLRGHLVFDVDAFGIIMGASNDVLLRWEAGGYFSTFFLTSLTDLRLSSPAANRFLWDTAGGGTSGEFNFNCARFSLGGQTGAVGNQVGVFVAPTRATGLAGGWSDFLLTQAGNITVNHAMSQLFGWTINAPSITLGTGSVVDAGALLIGGNVSQGTNRYGLHIISNPSGGGGINAALYVQTGLSRFDGRVDINNPIALGGGAAATLGTIGGTGPTAAAQAQWVEIDIGGTPHWIAVWV